MVTTAARGDIIITARLVDQASKALTALKGRVAAVGQTANKQIGGTATRAFGVLGGGIAGAGGILAGSAGRLGQLLFGITTAIVVFQAFAAVASTLGGALNLDEQLGRIEALTGASAESVAFLKDEIFALTKVVPKSPEELGAAAYFVMSSGFTDAADAAEILRVSAMAASAGLGETQQVADLVTSVLNAYSMGADKAGFVTDVLTAAVKEGKAEADEFAQSLGPMLTLAEEMGVSFEEVAAHVATLTRGGFPVSRAVTAIERTMSSLLKVTGPTEKALESIGLNADGVRVMIRERGLLTTLQDLQARLGDDSSAIAELFPNVRALRGALGILNNEGKDAEAVFKAVADSSGFMGEAFEKTSKRPSFQIKQALNDVRTAVIKLVDAKVLPYLAETVIPKLREAFGYMSRSLSENKDDIVATLGVIAEGFGTLLGAGKALAEWIMSDKTALITAITALGLAFVWMNPGGALLVGLAAIVLGLGTIRTEIKDLPGFLLPVRLAIGEVAQTWLGFVEGVLTTLDWLSLDPIFDQFVELKTPIDEAKQAVSEARAGWQTDVAAVANEMDRRALDKKFGDIAYSAGAVPHDIYPIKTAVEDITPPVVANLGKIDRFVRAIPDDKKVKLSTQGETIFYGNIKQALTTLGTLPKTKWVKIDADGRAFYSTVATISETIRKMQGATIMFDARMGDFPLGYQAGAWKVPETAFAVIHKGEMVLPQPVAERVRSAPGGLGAASMIFNHVTIVTSDPEDFFDQLRRYPAS